MFHFVWVDTRSTSPGSHGKDTLSLVENSQTILQRNHLSSVELFWLGVWSDMFYAYFKIFGFLFEFKVLCFLYWFMVRLTFCICVHLEVRGQLSGLCSLPPPCSIEIERECQCWQQMPSLPSHVLALPSILMKFHSSVISPTDCSFILYLKKSPNPRSLKTFFYIGVLVKFLLL